MAKSVDIYVKASTTMAAGFLCASDGYHSECKYYQYRQNKWNIDNIVLEFKNAVKSLDYFSDDLDCKEVNLYCFSNGAIQKLNELDRQLTVKYHMRTFEAYYRSRGHYANAVRYLTDGMTVSFEKVLKYLHPNCNFEEIEEYISDNYFSV